jgi:four helix bundle protein
MQDFKKLRMLQGAHELVLSVYRLTQAFPQDERFELVGQLRRSSVSIPANICEGSGKESQLEFRRYLKIASGSAGEVEYYLILARDLGYLGNEEYMALSEQVTVVRRMLWGLMSAIGRGTESRNMKRKTKNS